MTVLPLTDQEFTHFQRFIFDTAGITLSPAKKALVSGRLAKRLQQFNLSNYSQYFEMLGSSAAPGEAQVAVDLLTTNETYFFREMSHFDFLRQQAKAASGRGAPFRVWSAASSTGEEAYSIAMVLADCLGDAAWEVVGSDISSRVLEGARRGHYPMERAAHVSEAYLHRYCLKGTGPQEGTLLVDRALRSRVSFQQVNLNRPLPELGMFDMIFLRNVMIYFNEQTKREVVARVLGRLKPGGHFCIGHSESLNDISDAVRSLAPAIYQKAA
ncbi:MAG: protein-glutamate O-methyltransferase CheR [Burkholderiaceae bacterium]|nr:protein-glutamate O-methyltransferase CheR [Burkholderiaceae bacterium]